MVAIDRVIPVPRLRELSSVELAIPPVVAWAAIRHGDLGRQPLVHSLFALRTIASRTRHEPLKLSLDALVSSEARPGFGVLFEAPPTEVVVGAIGKVWSIDIPFVHVPSPAAFAAFRQPDFVKVAWSFRLAPLGAKHTAVAFELRVDATDEAAWQKFERYFRYVGPFSRLIRRSLMRDLARSYGTPEKRTNQRAITKNAISGGAVVAASLLTPFWRASRSHWGLSVDEAVATHPGDDVVREPRWSWTHAVEIHAPTAEVWPWVEQIGADRAGFYSYQSLENIVGCNIHNAESIHREWAVKMGDELRLHPKMPPLRVVDLRAGSWFVAEIHSAGIRSRPSDEEWMEASWLFLVERRGPLHSRFTSRFRCACSADLKTLASFGPTLLEPIGFAMDRKMLLGVKRRAERVTAHGMDSSVSQTAPARRARELASSFVAPKLRVKKETSQ